MNAMRDTAVVMKWACGECTTASGRRASVTNLSSQHTRHCCPCLSWGCHLQEQPVEDAAVGMKMLAGDRWTRGLPPSYCLP